MEVERVFGKISFPDPDNFIVENVWLNITSTSIYVEIPWDGFGHDEWSIIHGKFIGMDEVTFVGAYLSGGSSGGQSSYRRLYVEAMIKGAHLLSVENLIFNELNLFSPALLRWITEPHYIENEDSRIYKLPEKLKIVDETFKDFNLNITLLHSINSGFRNLEIYQNCLLKLSFKEKVNWKIIIEKIHLLKKFILFITNSDPSFSYVSLSKEDSFFEVISPSKNLDESNFSQNIRINYSFLKEHIPSILKLWFEQNKIQPIIDLLLEKYYNTSLSMPRHFQNVCIAIETYHEKFIKKNVNIIDTRKLEYREKIIDKISDDVALSQWFKKESNFWSKPELIDRLVCFKNLIQRLIGETIDCDIDNLLIKIKQTRNEITHQGISNKRLNNIELILTAKTIEFTVKLDIYRFCGVDIDLNNYSLINDAKAGIKLLADLNFYFDMSDRITRND
jgi:hypothetical protein